MRRRTRDLVRACLPVLALALGPGCGGGGSGGGANSQGAAPAPAPAPAPIPAPTPTPTPAPTPAPPGSNQAPTISGSGAASAPVGVPYEFQPTAADPDGDTLTFSAENLPPWATIDPGSGKLTGTPQASDVGEYESIMIVVADAAHQAATSPFNITVTSASNGVTTLQWEKSTSRVDGAPLDDLAGYRIVYGRDAAELDHSVYIADPEQTTYEFEVLEAGTWYFAVIGVSANGLEGPPTAVATKSI